MIGKVYSIISGIYFIKQEGNEKIHKIPASGKLRFNQNSPLVGDLVKFNENILLDILPRKNSFIRPKVANIDQVIVVMSLFKPRFNSFLLDKYLSIIEFKKITPILFFTKSDLGKSNWNEIYKNMGYRTYLINNTNLTNKDELKNIFKEKTSVFLGQTGVGKTTTINNLSNSNFLTQEISKALGRGKHTTREVRIIEYNNGELIDTPGFSSIDLELSDKELSKSFFFLQESSLKCKYRTCLHVNEDLRDCNIKQKVESKEWPKFRNENYLKLMIQTKKENWK